VAVVIDKEKTLESAHRATEKKKYDVAIDEYRKLASLEPGEMRWLLKVAGLQEKKGDLPGAITTYEDVAKYFVSKGFHLKAVSVYGRLRELIETLPAHIQTRFAHIPARLAEVYEKLHLAADAVGVWMGVADKLRKAGNLREEAEIVRKIIALDPTNFHAFALLAEILIQLKDVDKGVEQYAESARLLVAQNNVSDALKVYERITQLKPIAKYQKAAAELYLKKNTPTDALAAVAKAQLVLNTDKQDPEALVILARAFLQIGRSEQAVEMFLSAGRTAKDQKRQDVLKAVAFELEKTHSTNPDVQQFLSGISLEPQISEPKPTDQGPDSLSVDDVEIVEVFDDEEVPASVARPSALNAVATSTPPISIDNVEEIIEVEPPPPSVSKRIEEALLSAQQLRARKLFNKAITTLRIASELAPHNTVVRENIRDLLIETNQIGLAMTEMIGLAAIQIEDNDLQGAYDNLIWILETDESNEQAQAMMYELQVRAGNVTPEAEAAPEPEAPPVAATTMFNDLDDPMPLPSFDMDESTTTVVDDDNSAANKTPVHDVETVLDEAEFYCQQGAAEAARDVLNEALRWIPNHPLLLEKLRELESRPLTHSTPISSRYAAETSFDFGTSLDSLGAPESVGATAVDVDEVFQKFKLGVAEKVDANDSATHYDLGIAYEQMMLLDDAILEFQLAAKDPSRLALCQSMIGVIYEKKNMLDKAIDAYQKGLEAEHLSRDEKLGLLFQLATLAERKKDIRGAMQYYRGLLSIDGNYRMGEARSRLNALERTAESGTRRRNDIEEMLDAAFDEALHQHEGK
jgi:tetratricopeptide (TPR) repeat protein